jgi:UTP-glucose-1-phosphate uridylyltransferase
MYLRGILKMAKPALVIMAAGMGSRYGGLKQIEPIGPNGEIIIDYSIYDALKSGFGKIVFIIKKDLEKEFREKIGYRVEKLIDTDYAFQTVEDVPTGFVVPSGRNKPWGTGHAVMSCRSVVDTPFAVINADDFYGRTSFQILGQQLNAIGDYNSLYEYCMVGFVLENTLTKYGHVARGVCMVDERDYLKEIHERTRIERFGDITKYTEDAVNWTIVPKGSTVSMNTWGFTPSIFKELEERFPKFLWSNRENLLKTEYFLPEVVGSLIMEKKASVKVLHSQEHWYGVTYKEDKPVIKHAISSLIQQGLYPKKLWEDLYEA